jgi:uncharacterized membrane protein
MLLYNVLHPSATVSAAHKVKHAILAFVFIILLILIRQDCILIDRVVGLVTEFCCLRRSDEMITCIIKQKTTNISISDWRFLVIISCL